MAEKLKRAGDTVDAHEHDGVTHDFSGLGKVVGRAEDVAVKTLQDTFTQQGG